MIGGEVGVITMVDPPDLSVPPTPVNESDKIFSKPVKLKDTKKMGSSRLMRTG